MSDFSLTDNVLARNKLPPQDIEAEKATLGAMLLDYSTIGVVSTILKSDDFYKIAHQHIYKALLELYTSGENPDILVLKNKLETTNLLESVGGVAYIATLTDTVPSTANVEYYARIVLDASIRRSLIKAAHKILSDVYNNSIGSRDLLEEAQKKIFELTDAGISASFKKIADILQPFLEHLQQLRNRKVDITGVPSGFPALDSMTFGFQPSEFIIVGARPSIGKTAFAMSMAANIAIREKIPTAFFSLEMSEMQLTQRLLSLEAKLNSEKLRSANLTVKELKKLTNVCGQIYESPLYMVEMPNMKLLDLRAMARQLCTQCNVKIIFIDYIGLINSENYLTPRHEQIAEISRSLKGLARELGIPIVALSQLIRDAEEKRPVLSSIRESGSLEQDADVVMFLHRPRTPTNEVSEQPLDTELIVAKQRNGPTGTIHIDFIPTYTAYVPRLEHRE